MATTRRLRRARWEGQRRRLADGAREAGCGQQSAQRGLGETAPAAGLVIKAA